MRMLAVMALLGVAACTTPQAPTASVDPVEAFRPACRERWTTVFAVEKCALEAYDASRAGTAAASPASAPAATPAAATPAAATSARPTPARPATGNQQRR